MDEKIRKSCPNCSQLYHIKLQSPAPKGNLPLFLTCGHSMCEKCVRNIVKFLEPIECKICRCDMNIEASQMAALNQGNIKLYQLFPVNVHILGELTFQLMEHPESKASKPDKEYFVNLEAIMKTVDTGKADCMECHHTTTKMCQQCNTVLCDTCFTKTHKNFIIFQNHVLQNIEDTIETRHCKIHKEKPLDYYCNDCKKAICMDCLVVGGEKSCKNHNVVSMQEVNNIFLEDLGNISPKVDEQFRRLTKTAVDIGNLLHNIENDTGSVSELSQIIDNIEQHFSKLCSIVQKHKQEVLDIVIKLKSAEKESLHKAKNDVSNAIKKAKQVLDTVKRTSDPNKLKQVNLSVLLDDAKEVVESPWYLKRNEENKDPLKIAVNEDLCALISDYIHLEGNANSAYKLCSTEELGDDVEIPPPPSAPVFPPEMPKDVRQTKAKDKAKLSNAAKAKEEDTKPPQFFQFAPHYRSKSESVTSLNSLSSGSSHRSYIQSDGYNRPVVQQVQPFAESQHPKQLNEGSQELIYISHIVDPHNFYVQRACHQRLVKDMLREFRNAISLPKPAISHVAEGKTYLAFNKADNMWQRCRVISIDRNQGNNPLFHVFCFDFGSTETVYVDRLRLLPPARVSSPHPLAINCSLANCEPKAGAWSNEDAILIQNIIDNKQAVLHVRHIRSTSNYTVQLEGDITTFEDGVSIAHALVFHERAKMPNPRLQYPKVVGIKEKPKIYTSNDDYKPKTVEEVCITHIVSPDKFYIRKRHHQVVYENLSSDLDQEYSLGVKSGSIHLPEIGMACVVNVDKAGSGGRTERVRSSFEAVGSWARARVDGLPGRGRVALTLLDSGAPLLAHWTALRYLQPRLARLKALATECHLAGVTPLNKKWSPGSVNLLHKYASSYLEAHVEDTRARGSVGVTLLDKSDDEDIVCVNKEMIKYKFAVTFGVFGFNKNIDVDDQVITNKSPLDNSKPRSKPKPAVQVMQRNPKIKIKDEDLEAKDKGPLRLEAKVLQYQSPSLIYVSLAHQQKTFNELFEKIQKYYSSNKPEVKAEKKIEWKVGDRCCTVCFQSQTWRRAVILEFEGDSAKVFYSDFAFVETVPMTGLKALTEDFASIGDAAIKCHLCGVMPAVGEEWPSITKEFLKELLDAYNRVFITKLGHFKNKSMPIEIWVFHTIQGSALEANKGEWRCLNKKIVEQGLAIPDKSQEVAPTEVNTEGGDEMLSFLNVTGSVREWLQLEPMPTKPLATRAESPSRSGASTPAGHDEQRAQESDSSNVMFISDWLPPEPLPVTEFSAMPTYIDNDGLVYLHDMAQQDTLDLIRKALDVRFKDPDPKAKFVKWTIGEPCIARYFLDNRFYRGRVIEVDNVAATCLIHYIDYGNEELCTFVDMRKSIALHQIPTQAHKCVLDRVRPLSPHWDRLVLDYIHKSIVEKVCQVKVAGNIVGGVTPIELKYDKLWINDHLVEFEMAQYTDGSKAVIRKFAPSTQHGQKQVPESESEPDYIVEEDRESIEPFSNDDSFETSSLKTKDWNQMLEEDTMEGSFVTYPKNEEVEFKCNVMIINDIQTLELSMIHNDGITLLYEEMFSDVQTHGANMPPLKGIYENKACIALFADDQLWYRASILQYSRSNGRVKVRYVDYGNIGVVSLSDVREIDEEWAKMPPATVSVKLNGVKLNPNVGIDMITQHYVETFLDKGPFIAKVINNDGSIMNVELMNENGELVYKTLIEKEIFLKCDAE